MIVLYPVVVVGPPELPELAPKPRPAPAATALMVTVLVIAVIETLAQAVLAQGWPGVTIARFISLVSASARLYPDPGLFDPAQLFSAALLHAVPWGDARAVLTGLWALAVNAALILVIGRAWERTCGSAGLVGLVVIAMPLVGAIHLRHVVQSDPVVTSSALVAGMLAATATLLPGRRLRLHLAYWAVAAVGVVPLHADLRVVVGLYMAQELLRTWLANPAQLVDSSVALVAALIMGVVLGSLARPLVKRRPRT